MLFLDSPIPEDVIEFSSWGVVSGVTTNPLLVARDCGNVELETLFKRLLSVSTGPVSVELVSETYDEMLAEALTYHEWDRQRICIKIPFGEHGLRVQHQLAQRGVPTNVTCIMSFNQLYLASLAGATYVSLFLGRVRDMGYDALIIIQEMRGVLEREELASKIVIGSVRHPIDVSEALQAGAHIVTVPPAILRKMLWNPNTERTIAQFSEAWKNRAK